MVKHTHSVTFWYEHQSYQDSFMFTPSDPERAEEQARERILRERGKPVDRIEVTELPNAADTRARGTLCSRDNGLFPPTLYYQV